MWFLFALLTSLAWGSADLFYKKGSDSKDPFSHLKIVVAEQPAAVPAQQEAA